MCFDRFAEYNIVFSCISRMDSLVALTRALDDMPRFSTVYQNENTKLPSQFLVHLLHLLLSSPVPSPSQPLKRLCVQQKTDIL